jgi:nucleoside 2-deoxyribosyltransferase
MKKLRIYMAGPLFSMADRAHNLRLAHTLEAMDPRLECVLPQVTADQYLPDLTKVVADCFYQIQQADVVVACLEGPDADAGTAVEVGYAHALQRPIVGYRTDFRGSEVDGVNAMLRFSCQQYCQLPSPATSVEHLAKVLLAAVWQVTSPTP